LNSLGGRLDTHGRCTHTASTWTAVGGWDMPRRRRNARRVCRSHARIDLRLCTVAYTDILPVAVARKPLPLAARAPIHPAITAGDHVGTGLSGGLCGARWRLRLRGLCGARDSRRYRGKGAVSRAGGDRNRRDCWRSGPRPGRGEHNVGTPSAVEVRNVDRRPVEVANGAPIRVDRCNCSPV